MATAKQRQKQAKGSVTQVLIDRASGAAHLHLSSVRLRPGFSTDPAIHYAHEEVWCVVQGTGCFHQSSAALDDATVHPIGPGDSLFIAAGYKHWAENHGEEDFVFLKCQSPPPLLAEEKDDNDRQQGDNTMNERFEYKILVSDVDDETDEETLNGLGAQGWELINAIADVRAGEDQGDDGDANETENIPVTVFYLKRRKESM